MTSHWNAELTIGRETAGSQRRYSLLYWTTFLYIFGIPNFVHFDTTGRVSNAINATSVMSIFALLVASYVLVVHLMLERRFILTRRISAGVGLWGALLLELTFASVLEPSNRLGAVPATSYLLALFRLSQWLVCYVLLLAIYCRTPAERAMGMIVQLIGRICWMWIATVWIVLPIMPSQVFSGSEDNPGAARRLGGGLIAPSHVAMISSILFFYTLHFVQRGPKRWAACVIILATLVLTGSRAQQGNFLIAVLLYTLILTKKPIVRWTAIGSIVTALLIAVPLSDKLGKYFARGQSIQTLSTLDDRTKVWETALDAIRQHPILGYGYSVGAKAAMHDYWKAAHWLPPHAHNEWLEVALDGGLVALALFILLYGWIMFTAIRSMRRSPSHLFLFVCMFLFFIDTATAGEMSFAFRATGGILLMCFLALIDDDSRMSKHPSVLRRKVPMARATG